MSITRAAILLSLVAPLTAHRLDEYLQATLIGVEKNSIELQVRLAPGVAILPIVLAAIDTNGDGTISESEQRAYAARVVSDLSVTVDGNRLKPNLVSLKFPAAAEMQEGMGEIELDFRADLPPGAGNRRLVFENRHQRPIAAYLVNCLAPKDPDIHVVAQNRNESQSRYELAYIQAGARTRVNTGTWLAAAASLVLLTRLTCARRRAR